MNKQDTPELIIVGAGFAGSVMARRFAESGTKVKVVERRNHIGGNMYDFLDEQGIRIQKYGPHVFHTNNEKVYEFITKYCELEPYDLKCEVLIQDAYTPSPFNYSTIDQFYSEHEARALKKALHCYFGKSASILRLLSCDDLLINDYGQFLFEHDYRLYTAKQWGKNPEEIDPLVLERVPVLFSYRDSFFNDKYEGIPKGGFSELFKNILEHENIDICLGVDALEHIDIDRENKEIRYDGRKIPIIYTGEIDVLFGYMYGHLPYRSLYFEYEYYNKKSYQKVPVTVYPSLDKPYTRITEYTKLPYQNVGDHTVIAKEIPLEYSASDPRGNEPYYPVLTADSQEAYKQYRVYADGFENLILCGRLADFKYYNMDSIIDRSLTLYEQIKDRITVE